MVGGMLCFGAFKPHLEARGIFKNEILKSMDITLSRVAGSTLRVEVPLVTLLFAVNSCF